jgi:glycine betaine/proline transport system substrate-binding protein
MKRGLVARVIVRPGLVVRRRLKKSVPARGGKQAQCGTARDPPDTPRYRRKSNMKPLRKIGVLISALALILAACGDDDTAVDGDISGTINMARADWDTGYFQAEVYYQLLTELGYDVTHPEDNEIDATLFYIAASERDVDFWVNGWFPLHQEFLAAAPNATRVGNSIAAGGFQGYLVDLATAEEYGIESLEQIAADPELAALFDTDGDGRADLTGCDAGWGCHDAIEMHLEGEGLGDAINHVSASYSVLMADVMARHGRGEPVLFYTWTPNWTVGALPPGEEVMWINAPTHPDGNPAVPGVVGCATDPCDIGWAANDINVVANQDFLAEFPHAARLLEVVELPLGDVSIQNLMMDEGENSQADITRHAQEWIEENRTLVDTWLDEARAAG